MKLNISFKDFKKNHLYKKNQVIYVKRKCDDDDKVWIWATQGIVKRVDRS